MESIIKKIISDIIPNAIGIYEAQGAGDRAEVSESDIAGGKP